MIGYLCFALLAVAMASSVIQRSWGVFLAAAWLLPLTRAMPEPLGFVSSPINLMLIGMVLRVLGEKPPPESANIALPLRPQLLFLLVTLLIGFGIRGYSDLQGESHLLPLGQVAKNIWYWSLPLVFYALTFRAALLGLNIERMVLAVQTSMIFEAGWAVMERLQGASRSTAHLGEDNLAGSYFASMAAFFLAWYLVEPRYQRWLSFGAFALAMLALFSTLSRGGLLAAAAALVVVVLVFMVSAGKFRTKLGFALLIVVALANASLFVPQSVRDRVLETFGGADPEQAGEENVDASTAERLEYVRAAIQFSKESPLGHGAFIFPELILREHGIAKVAHNIYLTMFVEFGVQGFVAMLVVVFAVSLSLFHAFRKGAGDLQGQLGLALLGWWTGHIIAHVFLNSFFTMALVGQFWMLHACEQARTAVRGRQARTTGAAPTKAMPALSASRPA